MNCAFCRLHPPTQVVSHFALCPACYRRAARCRLAELLMIWLAPHDTDDLFAVQLLITDWLQRFASTGLTSEDVDAALVLAEWWL